MKILFYSLEEIFIFLFFYHCDAAYWPICAWNFVKQRKEFYIKSLFQMSKISKLLSQVSCHEEV